MLLCIKLYRISIDNDSWWSDTSTWFFINHWAITPIVLNVFHFHHSHVELYRSLFSFGHSAPFPSTGPINCITSCHTSVCGNHWWHPCQLLYVYWFDYSGKYTDDPSPQQDKMVILGETSPIFIFIIFHLFSAYGTPSAVFPPTCLWNLPISIYFPPISCLKWYPILVINSSMLPICCFSIQMFTDSAYFLPIFCSFSA